MARRRARYALSVVAVAALFGSVALPGYAFTAPVAASVGPSAQKALRVPVTDVATPVERDEFGAAHDGDDYPWPSARTYTASPLNYYYRECVDFVAWRLNRDAGTPAAPFAFTWSYLTPGGGDARQWKSAWDAHGWPTSSTPAVGDVAWWSSNHVAYVSAVNGDGTVTLEEYNWGNTHVYGVRTIAASAVELFLSAPPVPGAG